MAGSHDDGARRAPLKRESRPGQEAASPKHQINSSSRRYSQPCTAAQAALRRRLRRQRQVTAIYGLGPRVVLELLDEIDRHHGLGEDLDRRLEQYAALDINLLRALRADRFTPFPVRVVEGGR